MRALFATLAALALLAGTAQPAAASCAPPAPVAENAAQAVAVVYGVVTAADREKFTLRVERTLKGSVGGDVVVRVGPGRGGGLTSVDYYAQVGTDHVVYILRAGDGQLETNACNGTHAGPPTAEESAYFGASGVPSPLASPISSRPPLPATGTAGPAWSAIALAVAAAVVMALVLRSTRSSAR